MLQNLPYLFIEKENPHSFFCFSFQAFLGFTLRMPQPPVYVEIDQGILKVKLKVAQNKKRKKPHGFSYK